MIIIQIDSIYSPGLQETVVKELHNLHRVSEFGESVLPRENETSTKRFKQCV